MSRALLPLLLVAGGCIHDFDVEGRTYPCRAAEDCVDGYECHPTRYVCVPKGTGLLDGGRTALTRGLGASCGAAEPCDLGSCVDGVCCESACTETCRRCGAGGRCGAVADGADPDGDCSGRRFACSDYVFGLDGSSCVAGAVETATTGVCNGAGACRPQGCPDRPGEKLSSCLQAACVAAGACSAGAAAADFDTAGELCRSGAAAGCTRPDGQAGCCNLAGDCCPMDQCDSAASCP